MHYYPSDLAYALRHRWPTASDAALPAPPALTQLISVAYQASLLSEEARPVVGQLVFAWASAVAVHTADQSGVAPGLLRFLRATGCGRGPRYCLGSVSR